MVLMFLRAPQKLGSSEMCLMEWTLTCHLRHMQPARIDSASLIWLVGTWRSRDVGKWCMLAEFCGTFPANSVLEQCQCTYEVYHNYTFVWCSVQSITKVTLLRMRMRNNSWPLTNLLLPILKAFAEFICSIHPIKNACFFQSVCDIRSVFTLTNGSPSLLSIVNNLSAPRRTRLLPVGASC